MWKVSVASFRLSEKAIRNLEAYAQKVTKKNKNLTLNIILEELFEAPKQSEQPQKEGGDFLNLPPVLNCPLTNQWALQHEFTDITGCPDCLKKPVCPAWRKDKALSLTLPTSASRTYVKAHTWDDSMYEKLNDSPQRKTKRR